MPRKGEVVVRGSGQDPRMGVCAQCGKPSWVAYCDHCIGASDATRPMGEVVREQFRRYKDRKAAEAMRSIREEP